ncbi:MAG: AI-2E family transporter [Chloroflexi bacterium]|nr:AI-2E family transporter [Chloroflexota bacterium]
MLERSWWFRATLVVFVLSALIYLAGAIGRLWAFIGDLILIFFLAWLVGSVLIHMVNNLMRIPGMRRPLAILVVYLGLITLILNFAFLVGPTIDQIRDLASELPKLGGSVTNVISALDSFLLDRGLDANLTERVEINNIAANVSQWLETNAIPILQNVASAFFSTGLVLAISFYIVLDGGRRLDEALKVLPPRAERETRFVLNTIDQTFHGYVRGMLVVSLIYGVGTASVMFATGLPAALPTAIISSVLLAVPFVGDWLALILPLVIAFVAGDFITFLVVLSVLLFIQQVMLNLLTPRILGHAVRMPAMLVIVSVVLGARLAGIAGALLGVPTAGVVYTLSVHYGMQIRHRREAREAAERERREAEDDEGFTQELERALQSQSREPIDS